LLGKTETRVVQTGRSTLMFEFLDACKLDGCPVCRLITSSVRRFFDTLTYENTNDPGIRADLRGSRGFCNRHAWQYADYRDGLGTAILYRDVLREVLRLLHGASDEPLEFLSRAAEHLLDPAGSHERDRLLRDLAPDSPCMVCSQEDTSSQNIIDAFLRRLDEPDVVPAIAASSGLCRTHFREAIDVARQPARRSRLVSAQRIAWHGVQERVGSGDSTAAGDMLVGHPGVFS